MTTLPNATPTPPPPDAAQSWSLLDALRPILPDLSVGALLGFATGVALRHVGRVVLIVVGVLFIALQLLAYFDLISINWLKLQALTEPWLRQGGEQGASWLRRVLTANLPFAGAYTAGLLVGLRARV
ncbi:FUN14 domain-containing protein [Deinococcus sp.]|uniref:FUN14 domain-containing protein n=1 Tax=Deinococcus sp. TaxID=47478 RepID=UPI00286989A1|nr:FUN14 domain-containing protein [Deinococcus sp.]